MSSKPNNRLRQIKIKIKFNSKSFIIDVQPYKTIRFVKEQAKKYFYQISNINTALLYQNKDLSEYESKLLGEFFKGKATVCLRLIPSSTVHSYSEKRLRLTEANERVAYNQYLCGCEQGMISYYCRNCSSFICAPCKIGEKHLNHYTIHIDINKIEDSIKLYALTLQNDIHINSQLVKTYDINKTIHGNHSKVTAREETFNSKMEEIKRLYKEMNAVLTHHLSSHQHQYDTLMNEFNKTAKEANDDLEQFVMDLYRKNSGERSRISYSEMISLFDFIQKKETEYNEKTKDALAYRVNLELDSNVNLLYSKLENIVNEFHNSSNLLFGLSMNSYHIYELIKSKSSSSIAITAKENKRKPKQGFALNTIGNDYSSTLEREEQCKGKYSITAVDKDKDDRSKSNDNPRKDNKKITFGVNISSKISEEDQSNDKPIPVVNTWNKPKQTNALTRVYTKNPNEQGITMFFNGGKSRTPIKYPTHHLTDKDKSVNDNTSKGDHSSLAELHLEKKKKNKSSATIPPIDEIFNK